jgi:hypothetical protein
MVSVDRYSILDIAGKYLLLILKPTSYLKLNIFMLLRRAVPGSRVPQSVLPTNLKHLLPFFKISVENSASDFSITSKYFFGPFYVFSTEILVSWQHCLTPYAAKSKIGTAESKLNPQ